MIFCVLRKINLDKNQVSIIQFSQFFIFPFTVHNLSESDVKEERRKIKRLATKTQYGQGSCYYGSELILERLPPDEIAKWQTQNSSSESGISDENQNKEASSENRTDFKLLAQELNVKNVKVSLPRISPSEFILDRDSKSPSSDRGNLLRGIFIWSGAA